MTANPARPYRVLARSYRPTRLSELIGQEALVRTLGNALRSGRIAHAFLLSGIRGVGKTTTARILARGLNCTGPDGSGGPTPEPCGVCPPCVAMNEERPIDVIEMDAATRTGIDDIREIVDSVRYAPSSSRFKVYIIDEVHMLSEKAFNGLLKTLEEPPPHAKFVFATTEIRKLPVTVLSRCQRFDLRRVEPAALVQHLVAICAKEGVEAASEALELIANSAEGSVRDSLSLLDQAIALGDGRVEPGQVQEMLGLGDRMAVVELFGRVLAGDAAAALDSFAKLYALGADPATVLVDLLGFSHAMSRLKVGVAPGEVGLGLTGEVGNRLKTLAGDVSLAKLARLWQMLLKGLEEVRQAPATATAAEMVLLRLALASDLPSPAELARLVRDGAPMPSSSPAARAIGAPGTPTQARGSSLPVSQPLQAQAQALAPVPSVTRPQMASQAQLQPRAEPVAQPVSVAEAPVPMPQSFAELVDALRARGHGALAGMLYAGARLLRFEPGRIELALGPGLPTDLAARLGEAASAITGRRWLVALGQGKGEPTLVEQSEAAKAARLAALRDEAEIRRVLEAFPGADLVDLRPATAAVSPLADEDDPR